MIIEKINKLVSHYVCTRKKKRLQISRFSLVYQIDPKTDANYFISKIINY
jgi:hypothetical protein